MKSAASHLTAPHCVGAKHVGNVQANFYPSLRQFLVSPTGARFMGDIVFVNEDPMQDIFAARSSFQWKYIENTQEQVTLGSLASLPFQALAAIPKTGFEPESSRNINARALKQSKSPCCRLKQWTLCVT